MCEFFVTIGEFSWQANVFVGIFLTGPVPATGMPEQQEHK